ncbi:MAG: helix-turn-helix domain-containing protein [Alphaproteobacteria bacterium]|nr:helix-turn-helix domain-containing protein [Alphaproteobacteria bacterium]
MAKSSLLVGFDQPEYDMKTAPILNVFESAEVIKSDRHEFWKSRVLNDYGVSFFCEPEEFSGRMRSKLLGRYSVHSVEFSQAHRAERIVTNPDIVFVNCMLQNEGAKICGKREKILEDGGMVVYEASEPYFLSFDGASKWLVLGMLKSDLADNIGDLDRHFEEQVTYDSQLVAALSELMFKILNANLPEQQSIDDALGDSVFNLLLATILSSDLELENSSSFSSTAMLQRARRYVRENLVNPDLEPSIVSDALGITTGYLHKVFSSTNTTLMQYVLTERLEKCRVEIGRMDRARNITQIAFKWGFNDTSHFSRTFRRRFGVSAKEYRDQVQKNRRYN